MWGILSSIDNFRVVSVVPVTVSFYGDTFLVVEPDNMDNFESHNHKVVTID